MRRIDVLAIELFGLVVGALTLGVAHVGAVPACGRQIDPSLHRPPARTALTAIAEPAVLMTERVKNEVRLARGNLYR